MPAGNYNIQVDQGSTFIFYIEYQTEGGTGEDLRGYTAEMQVRRSVIDPAIILQVSGGVSGNNAGVTHGGDTGEFVVGATFSGTVGSPPKGRRSQTGGPDLLQCGHLRFHASGF